MQRPKHKDQGPQAYAAEPDGLIGEFPLLAEYLTATFYEGEPVGSRQTGTLLVFAQDGSWRAVLRDRAENRCLWVTAATWEDLLPALENALGDPSSIWRADRVGGAPEATRQKPKNRP